MSETRYSPEERTAMALERVADAIELFVAAEAASAERARLRAAVEALTGTVVPGFRGAGQVHEPTREAVLALLTPDKS